MAKTTATDPPQQTTDAQFKAWATDIHNAIVTTAGWYATGETGTTAMSALTHPTVINTVQGYQIYKMTDTLGGASSSNGAAPIYIKVEYGSGGGASGVTPAIWLTVGTGSNGSGTITGVLVNRVQLSSISAGSATTWTSYFSGNTNRIQICMWGGDTVNAFAFGSNTANIFFSIERTKDTTGADTAAGVLVMYNDIAVAQPKNLASLVANSIPTIEAAARGALNVTNTTMIMGNSAGVVVPIMFSPAPQNPGLGFVTGWSADFARYSQLAVSLYGVSHNYIWLTMSNAITVTNGTAALGMQFE